MSLHPLLQAAWDADDAHGAAIRRQKVLEAELEEAIADRQRKSDALSEAIRVARSAGAL